MPPGGPQGAEARRPAEGEPEEDGGGGGGREGEGEEGGGVGGRGGGRRGQDMGGGGLGFYFLKTFFVYLFKVVILHMTYSCFFSK